MKSNENNKRLTAGQISELLEVIVQIHCLKEAVTRDFDTYEVKILDLLYGEDTGYKADVLIEHSKRFVNRHTKTAANAMKA